MEPWQYLADFAIQQEDYQSALRYMSKIDGLGGEVKFDFFPIGLKVYRKSPRAPCLRACVH